ncbi:MAG TPA: MBL fold metallo-hydrolase, partial [Verrucomicrobiota bacterium]|nr:MBL fold metallo-hydrolase [Verrucomicrobiota bacterium]
MKLRDLNPGHGIGASAWHVEMDGHGLLMDAGTHPKHEGTAALPLYDMIRNRPVDTIAVTHCHHDHVGSLPVALRIFPRAHVMMTELSYFIVERVLHNSVNVMKRQAEEQGVAEYPLYSHREVDELAPLFQGYRYNREIEWGAFEKAARGLASPTLEFHDAGHALGSAGIMVRGRQETLFYTGDVCLHDQTLLKAARFGEVQADVMIMETTRGTRETPIGYSRAGEIEKLVDAIDAAFGRGGSVLIPTFALGRTQEMLATLALLMKEGRLREQPVFIGGLGRVFTEIYDLQSHRANRQHTSLQLNEALDLSVLDRDHAATIKLNKGRLFVMTAGMLTENTTAYELAKRMVAEPKHGIFFVGYADPETPGGRLKAATAGET